MVWSQLWCVGHTITVLLVVKDDVILGHTITVLLVVKDDVILYHRACAYLNKLAAAVFISKVWLKLFVLALLFCQSLS